MGDKYSVGLTQTAISTLTSGNDGVGEILAGVTSHRPRIYDLLFSHGGTPADNTIRWITPRVTTSATGSAAQENSLDFDAPNADATTEEEFTVGGTVTADTEIIDIDLNQRATFRWVAAPGGEIVLPATAASGIMINASSAAYTGIARCTIHWEE